MRFKAVSPDGRVIIGEINENHVKITRKLNGDSPWESIETEDKLGIETQGVEQAMEKWWNEGWEVTVEDC